MNEPTTSKGTAGPHPGVFVHSSSFVDDPCEIGEGTKVWHFSHVMKDCRIGRNCNLGQNVVVSPGVTIGNNVKIQNNVSVYTGCILEDDVFCGPSMVFTNVINPRSHVERKNEYKRTLVKRGASMGANSTIICGITIGAFAFIGAGSVVSRDVPDYALVFGSPAKVRGWVCACGIKIEFDAKSPEAKAQCTACGVRYEKREQIVRPVA
jgi:UDP-2-acetamido-3-amino-2,3-dideoxy-glucuronate N-acetyltransferase